LRKLLDYGYERGKAGYRWTKEPTVLDGLK